MTDPARLLTSSSDAFELALLRAEASDPEHAARSGRLVAALGLDLGAPPPDGDGGPEGSDGGHGDGGPAPGAEGAPTATNGGALGAGAQASLAPSAAPHAKLGALVFAGALVGGTAIVLWPAPGASPPHGAAALPSSVFEISAPAVVSAPAAETSVPVELEPQPSARPIAPKPPSRAAPSAERPEPRPAQPGLAAEIRALDQARGALRRGDRAGARNALNAYFNRFPAGTLAPEARALSRRIEEK